MANCRQSNCWWDHFPDNESPEQVDARTYGRWWHANRRSFKPHTRRYSEKLPDQQETQKWQSRRDSLCSTKNIEMRPHDLRRHAASYASKSCTPIEIVSKVILRHSDLSTQRYLGKVNDSEAIRWIETLYGWLGINIDGGGTARSSPSLFSW